MPTVTMMMILGMRSRDVPLGAPVLPRRLRPREGSSGGPAVAPQQNLSRGGENKHGSC